MGVTGKTAYDVIIVGGGPAGLAAAIESSRRGLSSVILDRNKKPGKKLYATGNGRCNVTNKVMDGSCYYGSSFAQRIMENVSREDGCQLNTWVLQYLEELGVPCVEKGGYYYPRSLQASAVVWALTDAARLSGAEIVSGMEAVSAEEISDDQTISERIQGKEKRQLQKERIQYRVKTASGEEFRGKALILAAGGASQPHLGAFDIFTCSLLTRGLNLKIKPFRPVLGPIPVDGIPEELNGVRVQGRITAVGRKAAKETVSDQNAFAVNIQDRNPMITETGELQLLTGTLSGIAAFQVSPLVAKEDAISINLLHSLTKEGFLTMFQSQKRINPKRRVYAFLNGYLPDKLALFLIKKVFSERGAKVLLEEVEESEMEALYFCCTEWQLRVIGEVSADSSQASAGGLMTDSVDPSTMAVLRHDGLYAAGEMLDVLGKCGGYNISFALRTGYLAGRHVLK